MLRSLVRKLDTIARLPDDDRRALEVLGGTTRQVARGKDIVSEGEKPDHVHILVEGWAARYKVLPDGARQITAFLLSGDLCDMELIVFPRMDHSVFAVSPAMVAYVPRDALLALTRARPALAEAFWRTVLVDESILRTWLVGIGRRDAYARVAHLACELHARMRNIGLAANEHFDLPLSQEMLAEALGLTPVHVNRVLKRLREEELMIFRGGTLAILDARRLGQVAGFDDSYLHA